MDLLASRLIILALTTIAAWHLHDTTSLSNLGVDGFLLCSTLLYYTVNFYGDWLRKNWNYLIFLENLIVFEVVCYFRFGDIYSARVNLAILVTYLYNMIMNQVIFSKLIKLNYRFVLNRLSYTLYGIICLNLIYNLFMIFTQTRWDTIFNAIIDSVLINTALLIGIAFLNNILNAVIRLIYLEQNKKNSQGFKELLKFILRK